MDTDEDKFKAIEARLAAGDLRMGDLQAHLAVVRQELARNSEVTEDIREILAAAKVGLRVLGGIGQAVRWLSIVATACVAIWGAWQAFMHGSKP